MADESALAPAAAAAAAAGPSPAPAAVLPFMPRQLFYYDCDGFGDTGWGCGYRCLQTLLSGVEREPPSFADVVTALNGREGVYADVGDIQVLLQSRYGWGAAAILLPIRSEIPHFLARLERLLHDPTNRHPWVLLAGGGIIVLVSDVDAAGGRLQVFDPHGPLGDDDSGMGALETLGRGGFGWVAAEAGLLGCAEPGIAAALSPDELFMHMSWTALVFDRRPDLPQVPEPPRPPPPAFAAPGGAWQEWDAVPGAGAPAPAVPAHFSDGSAWAFGEGGWAGAPSVSLGSALPPLGLPGLPPMPAIATSRGLGGVPYATLPAPSLTSSRGLPGGGGVYATLPPGGASAGGRGAAQMQGGMTAEEQLAADTEAAIAASLGLASGGNGGGGGQGKGGSSGSDGGTGLRQP